MMRRGTWMTGCAVLGVSMGALGACTTITTDDDLTATGGTASETGGTANATGGAPTGGTGGTSSGGGGGAGGEGGEGPTGPVQTADFYIDTLTIQPTDGEPTTLYDFATDLEGWGYDAWQKETDDTDPAELSSATWVGTEGDPDLGSAHLVIPFNAYGQKTGFQLVFDDLDLQDWGDSILKVRIKWVSGFNTDPEYPGGLQFAVKTNTSWLYGEAAWQNVTVSGEWVEYTFDLTDPGYNSEGWDPTQVKAVALIFNAGSGPVPL